MGRTGGRKGGGADVVGQTESEGRPRERSEGGRVSDDRAHLLMRCEDGLDVGPKVRVEQQLPLHFYLRAAGVRTSVAPGQVPPPAG